MKFLLLFVPILAIGQAIQLTPANPVVNPQGAITISADRPVTYSLSGTGSLSVSDSKTVTYSAPASIRQSHVMNGCMVTPGDSIFNTRIDNLPVHSQSGAWTPNLSSIGLMFTPQWGTTLVDSSVPLVPQSFFYTTYLNGALFPVVPHALQHREAGAYTQDGFNDHHLLMLNPDSCTFYESYQDNVPNVDNCSDCTAASGLTYSSASYATVNPQGGVDAAGLPLAPLTVHLDEIESGSVRHAMRFTTCAGCISQTVLWPAVTSTGWASSGAPMGARFRLKASFDISSYPPAARTVLTALKQYGMFLADIGLQGDITFSSDVTRDTTVMNELAAINGLSSDEFEVVDESSLMLSPTLTVVNPGNPYVHPTSAILTVTDAANPANQIRVPVALQPITVGTPESALTVVAGTQNFPVKTWVNGSSNQSVVWSVNPALGAGYIDNQGNYTAPANVSGIVNATLTAQSVVDPNAIAIVKLTVIPGGTLRIDTASSDATVDDAGNSWLPDLGFETGSYSDQNDWYPTTAWSANANAKQLQTYKYTWGDDIVYRLHVPNGNYQVTLMLAQGNTSGAYTPDQFDNGLIWGPMNFESQGVIMNHMWDLAIPTNGIARVGATATFPAQVTDTSLVIAVRATTTPRGHSAPFLSGVTIAPTGVAPHLSVDSQRRIVPRGASLQLYATDWFSGSHNITWVKVAGPGSITRSGLFTAPFRLTTGKWTLVRAQDLTTGQYTTYNLFTPAPGQVIPPNIH